MQIVFHLYDVLKLDSTVVSYVLINISSPKLNNQIFKNFEAFLGQNKVQICKL